MTPLPSGAEDSLATSNEERLHVEKVIERLDNRFPDIPRQTVEEIVRTAQARFANRKVRDFVPLLVERTAREAIQGPARSPG